MRGLVRLSALLAAAAFAVAVPASAKQPPHPTHPAHPSHPSSGNGNNGSNMGGKGHANGKSRKCTAHNVAYRASGTLVSFSATQGSDGRYTGTITVAVTRTNHHASGDRGNTVTYTLTDARVRFGKGTSGADTGDRVNVIGKVTTLAKKCDQTGFTPTVTVRKVDVRRAHTAK